MIHQPSLKDCCLTRRNFLARCGMGMGAMSLAALFGETSLLLPSAHAAASVNPLSPKIPPFPGKAKRVVHFFLNGGPSHVDMFDPKPALARYAGRPIPNTLPTERRTGAAFPSPFRFRRYGQSGIPVSDLFARTAAHVDDI